MTWRQQLGLQIRNERLNKGLTLQGLAEKTSVSRVQIANYEKGKSAPAVNIVTEIATVLKCVFVIGGIEIGAPTAHRLLDAIPIQGRLQFDTHDRFSAASITVSDVDPKGIGFSFTLSSNRAA